MCIRVSKKLDYKYDNIIFSRFLQYNFKKRIVPIYRSYKHVIKIHDKYYKKCLIIYERCDRIILYVHCTVIMYRKTHQERVSNERLYIKLLLHC